MYFMENKIPVKQSLKQQIWDAANKNLYTVTICRCRVGVWQADGDIQYWLKVLNEVKRLNNQKIKR